MRDHSPLKKQPWLNMQLPANQIPKNERRRSNPRYRKMGENILAIEILVVPVVYLPLMHKVRKRWIWLRHTSPQAEPSA